MSTLILVLLWRSRRARAIAPALFIIVAAAGWIRLGPIPRELLDDPRESTVVVDRAGVLLYEALSDDGTRAMNVAPDALPPALIAATIAAEDRRFFSHIGVDPIAVARALKVNLAERRVVEGGSTISQQVAKLLLNREDPRRSRGFAAKIREAILALRLEHRFAKRELLALYLNLASYGNQIVGVERASQTYFGIPVAMTTPAQAALLAGLPQRPSNFNPLRHAKAATARQRSVLRRMAAAHALSNDELEQALAERLVFKTMRAPFTARHFVEMALADKPRSATRRIETTLDAQLQTEVAAIIASHRSILDRHGAANVAVVVLSNATGEWLAWEGSGNYSDLVHGGAINGPLMPRQPGSALKPFTYALAFERGATPATVLADIPSHFPTAQPGVVYAPRNYDGQYRGPLLARRALAGSENVPAVALASEIGVADLLRFLTRAGLTTFEKNADVYGLGVTLGNAEVRLDELVAAYAAFARGGEWIEPTYLRPAPGRGQRRIVSPRTAFWISDVLADAEAREFIFGRGGSLEFAFPVAVKTGTSQAYHDNWTIGFTRDVTVGVWVGNFDRSPLRNSSGVTGAAPIFHAVMLAASARFSRDIDHGDIVRRPQDVHPVEVCAVSGQAVSEWCPLKQREWLPQRILARPCDWHRRVGDTTELVLAPQYHAWADSEMNRHHGARALTVEQRLPTTTGLQIASPPDGATYLIDPTLRRDFQTLTLRVVSASDASIEWSVNGVTIAAAAAGEAVDWPLTPGRHRVVARTVDGKEAVASIDVR